MTPNAAPLPDPAAQARATFDSVHGLPAGWVERARFLQRHHHLIVPLFYDVGTRARLDAALLLQMWQRCTPKEPAA